MFSNEPRCLYRKNQLGEVICQLRFPEILSIETTTPAAFQEAIRDEFPQYAVLHEAPAPKITGAPGNFAVQNQPATVNYQFTSADGNWRINLTSKFISLSCNKYTCWEEFAAILDKPLVSFIQIYKPAFFERIGLRYMNIFSRRALDLEGESWRDLIAPHYLGILAAEDVGLANPNALLLANACFQTVHNIGMPEARITLAETTIYLATSPKSNSAYAAINKALAMVERDTTNRPVPLHLRNAPTKLMGDMGYGANYRYAHDYTGNFVAQEFLPESLSGTRFYTPNTGNAQEAKIAERIHALWGDKYEG